MKYAKQVLALMLAIAMTIGMTPVAAFAVEEKAPAAEAGDSTEESTEKAAPPEDFTPEADGTDEIPAQQEDEAAADEALQPDGEQSEHTELPDPDEDVTDEAELYSDSEDDTEADATEVPQQEELPELFSEGESTEYVPEQVSDGTDNEALFRSYVDRMLKTGKGSSGPRKLKKGGSSRLTGNNAVVYAKLKEYVSQVAAGERASTQFVFTLDDLGLDSNGWTASDLGVVSITETDPETGTLQISAAAGEAVKQKVGVDQQLLISTLLVECPYELYWYDKTAATHYSMSSYSATYDSARREYVIGFKGDVITLSLPVASEFSAGDAYTVEGSFGTTVETVKSTAQAIVDANRGYSDYDKLVNYRKKICELVSYNDHAAQNSVPYGNPWQLLWVFDGNPETNVVCEGYSKAFQYLCDLTDFDGNVCCYTVTGTTTSKNASNVSNGAHMWNIVRMGDGRNYLADVTNCDAGKIGADDKLFLAGYASGDRTGGYIYQCSGGDIKYTYDKSTTDLYDAADLELSDQAYRFDPERPEQTDLKTCSITVQDAVYTGEPIRPDVQVYYGSKLLTEGTDYTVTYANNTNAGTATVTITSKGNYTGTISKTFQIGTASISGATVDGIADKTYTGSAITQTPTVKLGSTDLKSGTDYTVTYANNTNAGTATVTITGKGNYSGTISKTFQIGKASISGATVTGIADKTYTGSAITQTPAVKLGSTALKSGTDYTVTYANNTNAGTATVTITGKGNYAGTIRKTFTISKISNTITAKSFTKTANAKKAQSFTIGATALDKAKLTYKSSNKNVTVNAAGKVTIKKGFVGQATITITAVAMANRKAATKKITITVNPAKAALSSAKNTASKKMTVKWKKTAGVTGYQIQYSTAKNFKKGNKTVNVKGANKTSQVIGKLSKGKTYYVRIRTYKKVSGKTYYSAWSGVKSVKIKK